MCYRGALILFKQAADDGCTSYEPIMHEVDSNFIVIGSLLLVSLAVEYLGRITSLPRVSLLIGTGFLISDHVLALVPGSVTEWFGTLADLALLLVGFLLGGKCSFKDLRMNGRAVLSISIVIVILSMATLTLGFLYAGFSIVVALLLAAISTATDPAATVDVIIETKSKGRFTNTLQQIVAVDDIWGLVVFSIVLAMAGLLNGNGTALSAIYSGAYELMGAVVLGIALGVPMALLSGRLKPGEPTLIEALGIVFLCGGLANYFDVPFLLTAMILGATVANLAKHHDQAFHEIGDIEWPFMVLFFILIGSSLPTISWVDVVPLTAIYIVLRVTSRVAGGWLGAKIAGSDPLTAKWVGIALLPQAGVANGMALIAANQFPQVGLIILPVIVLSTIFFELIGPVFTHISLKRVGDITRASAI